jgi:hypothetical protein
VNWKMKKIATLIILICLFTNMATKVEASSSDINEVTMKQDLLCLMMAYPEYITNIAREDNGHVFLIMKSGKRILYDDKKIKSYEQKLSNPDLQDMMEQAYPLTPINNLMNINVDPGRYRVYELLSQVYGESKRQVESNLKNVTTGWGQSQFNNNNNAGASLNAVMKELLPLAAKRKDVGSCVFPCSGTYNYRVIAGTNRLSPHAFGIAIDLARDSRDFWKWASREEGEKRLVSYPKEIVQIFEKNNFVWGGKWGHFDILHFEYRPEIILKARYFGEKCKNEKLWYKGVPNEKACTKKYIEIIDTVLS